MYERDRDKEKIRIPGPIKENIAVYVSRFSVHKTRSVFKKVKTNFTLI